MGKSATSTRELQDSDIPLVADYWAQADAQHFLGMGVDVSKLPSRENFTQMLFEQLATPIAERQSYCTIWEVDGNPIGHCNVNNIQFADNAFMHLHLWNKSLRARGIGATLVLQSLAFFFGRLELQDIYCEPYALNPAPNRVLAKIGFKFVEEYTTTPGPINFEQPVKRWHMTRAEYQALGNADDA